LIIILHQISILERFLKDHVTRKTDKFSFAIAGIQNGVLKVQCVTILSIYYEKCNMTSITMCLVVYKELT